jgi:hypothetical protein
MARTKFYGVSSKAIFGLRRSQHRAFVMPKILKYYYNVNKRLCKRKGKQGLLEILEQLERNVTREEYEVIQDWLRAKRYSEKRLHRRLNTSRGIENEPEGPDSDTDDDQPSFTKSNRSKRQPLIECSACLENLDRNSFPEQKLTELCSHDPTTCEDCLTRYLDTQIPILNWDQLQCPDCRVPLPYDAVKRWASPEAFEKYESPSLGNVTSTFFDIHSQV